MILALTSLGIGLCGFVAGVKGHHVDSALNIIISLCSTLRHAHGADDSKYRGGQIIGFVDRAVAKIITVKYFYESVKMGLVGLPTTLSCAYVVCVFYKKIAISKEFYKKGELPIWHMSMHLVGEFGVLYKHLVTN